MIYCISFESEYNHATWQVDDLILPHSHAHNFTLDILYGMSKDIVNDSGSEHFNCVLVF